MTEMISGFPEQSWKTAKKEATTVLRDVARKRRLISYSDLCGKISSISFEPHDVRYFKFLGEVSSDEADKGRGLLTVLVVHKNGDQQPGPGFFELAQDWGRDVSDIYACWISELTDVHNYWASKKA